MKFSLLALLWALLIPAAAFAAEFYGEAQVTGSVPILKTVQNREQRENCPAIKPTNGGLLAMINWDLANRDCTKVTSRQVISAYRVSYFWDDQNFTRIFAKPPGNTVPIKISID
ncbi:MAG: hypothetical protein VB957_13215 [Pseudomonadales bacterium]|jgi:hypothetical protein